MRDAAPFLGAVVARPDDDLPRLIFADYLDEHGGTERAEFIRLQCAAARGEADAVTASARRRAAVLEAAHRDEWLAPLYAWGAYYAHFRRGFPEHVVAPARALVRDGDALRRLTPLRGISLVGAGQVLRELTAGPALRGLAALHLTGCHLGDEGAEVLAAAPALADITVLRLNDAALGDEGVLALADAPHLGRLETLDLRDNAVGDFGALALARSGTLTRLTSLDLTGNEIGPAGQAALGKRFPAVELSGQRVAAVGRRPALPAAK